VRREPPSAAYPLSRWGLFFGDHLATTFEKALQTVIAYDRG
jgi:hypothetical protein